MAVGAGGGLASPLTLSKLRWGGRVVVVMVVATVVMVVLMVVLMVVVVGLGLGLEEGRGMKLAAITQPGSVSGQEGRCSCTGDISTGHITSSQSLTFIRGGGLAGLALHSALKGVTAQISWVQSCLLASLLQVYCTVLYCTVLHCTVPAGVQEAAPGVARVLAAGLVVVAAGGEAAGEARGHGAQGGAWTVGGANIYTDTVLNMLNLFRILPNWTIECR